MKRISLPLFVALILLFQGCIKEDLSICKTELLLGFRYTLNNQYIDLFGPEVNRIVVYIFDMNGKYVDSFSEQGSKLSHNYVMHLSLPEGKYQVVAYGGDFNTYSVGELDNQTHILNQTLRKGVTDINDFRVELKNAMNTDGYLHPLITPDDHFAGFVTEAASVPNNQYVIPIELIKDTKKIKVKISGTDYVSGPFEIYITASNGRYNFDNNLDLTYGTFKYTPINTFSKNNYLEVNLKMMRLVLGQSPMLVIKNSATSEIFYNENMIDQILSTSKYATQEDLDRENEYVFEIKFQPGGHDLEISVSINGWKIQNVIPDYN